MLSEEARVYCAAFPGDKGLQWLLKQQLVLSGKLPCGAEFFRPGGRASGDFNTGMGNTLGMLAVVIPALESFGVRFDVLADGDNALVFLERRDFQGVMGGFAAQVLNSSGQELTLEPGVSVIEQIRFGQSAPVYTGPRGWVMVRDYKKVLSTATSSHRWLREPAFAREYLTGVARCELSLARGLPVLQAYSLSLLSSTGFTKKVRAHPYLEYFVIGAWFAGVEDVLPVLPETRSSFERAFGLSPDAQVRVEGDLVVPNELGYTVVSPFADLDLADPGVMETWLDSRV